MVESNHRDADLLRDDRHPQDHPRPVCPDESHHRVQGVSWDDLHQPYPLPKEMDAVSCSRNHSRHHREHDHQRIHHRVASTRRGDLMGNYQDGH